MLLPAPTASVCVPVRGEVRGLVETLRSVLDQSFRDLEVVVLDESPRGSATAVARGTGDPRVRVERGPVPLAAGASQAEHWNRAVQLARGELVKLVRPDDLLHPRCLELQVDAMETDPGLAVVAARRHLVDAHSRLVVPRRGLRGLIGVRSAVEVARRVARSGTDPVGEPAVLLFRRDAFLAERGFRADRTAVAALDLTVRLLRHGDFLGLPEPLAASRAGGPGGADAREQHRALVADLLPDAGARGLDRALGRVLGPVGRARHRVLLTVMGAAPRRSTAEQGPDAPRAASTERAAGRRGTEPRGSEPRGTGERGTDEGGQDERGTARSRREQRADDRAARDRRSEVEPSEVEPSEDRRGRDRRGGDEPGSDPRGTARTGTARTRSDRTDGDRIDGDRIGSDRAGSDRAGGDEAGRGRDRAGGTAAGDGARAPGGGHRRRRRGEEQPRTTDGTDAGGSDAAAVRGSRRARRAGRDEQHTA